MQVGGGGGDGEVDLWNFMHMLKAQDDYKYHKESCKHETNQKLQFII